MPQMKFRPRTGAKVVLAGQPSLFFRSSDKISIVWNLGNGIHSAHETLYSDKCLIFHRIYK